MLGPQFSKVFNEKSRDVFQLQGVYVVLVQATPLLGLLKDSSLCVKLEQNLTRRTGNVVLLEFPGFVCWGSAAYEKLSLC